MTTGITSDNGTPTGYPPADWERDRLGMFGGDQIWRALYPLLINPHDQKPLLPSDAFTAFRSDTGAVLSITSRALGLADDNAPATLEGILQLVDNERARSSAAFSKFIDTLTEAKCEIDDAARSLYSAFTLIENGLEDLGDDLVEEAEEAAAAAGR
jgi:hypothetical protein